MSDTKPSHTTDTDHTTLVCVSDTKPSHTTDTDHTTLVCVGDTKPSYTTDTDHTTLVCVGGVNRIVDKSRLFSVVLNRLETEQFCPVLSVVLSP